MSFFLKNSIEYILSYPDAMFNIVDNTGTKWNSKQTVNGMSLSLKPRAVSCTMCSYFASKPWAYENLHQLLFCCYNKIPCKGSLKKEEWPQSFSEIGIYDDSGSGRNWKLRGHAAATTDKAQTANEVRWQSKLSKPSHLPSWRHQPESSLEVP